MKEMVAPGRLALLVTNRSNNDDGGVVLQLRVPGTEEHGGFKIRLNLP